MPGINSDRQGDTATLVLVQEDLMVWDFVVYFVWIFEITELPLFMISS